MGVMNGSLPAPDEFDSILYGERRRQKPFVIKQEKAEARFTKDEALSQVSDLTGMKVDELLQGQRGRNGNAGRSLAVWWLIHGAGMRNVEVGGLLGITPSAVSKILAQIRDNKSFHIKLGRLHLG